MRKKGWMVTAAILVLLTACGSGNTGTAELAEKLAQEKSRAMSASAEVTEEAKTTEVQTEKTSAGENDASRETTANSNAAAQTTTAESKVTAVQKESAGNKTAAAQKEVEDPVKNNGGMYIKVGDDYWFRFYRPEANEATALWGDFMDYPIPGSEKIMKCLKKDGTLLDAFTDTGYGKIWYIDGLFYLTQRDNNRQAATDHIYTIRPDGGGKKTLTSGTLVSYDPGNRVLIISTRSAADGSHILLSRSLAGGTNRELLPGERGEMTVHALKSGKLIFDRTDYSADPASVSLYCADLKEGKTEKLADLPAEDEYGDHVKVYETVFGRDGNTVYYSWGYLGGTAQAFQSGAVASVKISEPLNETYLTELPYNGLFHVDEEKGILEYETSVTKESEICHKVRMDMKTGKSVVDTEDLNANGPHLPFEPYYDRWYTGGLCMDTAYLEKMVMVPHVIPDPGSDAEGIVTDIRNAEYVGGKIFYIVNTSTVNKEESVGWRTAYTLQHTELNVASASGSGAVQALCQATVGVPQYGEGGEHAETERIGFIKEFQTDGDHGWFQFKPMLWIDGNDAATLKEYGLDPASITDDYMLIDSGEAWEKYEWTMDDTKFSVQYDNARENVTANRKLDFGGFEKYMNKAPKLGDWVEDSSEERGILVKITLADNIANRVLRVDEVYVP